MTGADLDYGEFTADRRRYRVTSYTGASILKIRDVTDGAPGRLVVEIQDRDADPFAIQVMTALPPDTVRDLVEEALRLYRARGPQRR